MFDKKEGCYFYLVYSLENSFELDRMISLCAEEINFLYLKIGYQNKSSISNSVNMKYITELDKIKETIEQNEFNLDSIIIDMDISGYWKNILKVSQIVSNFRSKYPIHFIIRTSKIDNFITSDDFIKITQAIKVTEIFKLKREGLLKVDGSDEMVTFENFKLSFIREKKLEQILDKK